MSAERGSRREAARSSPTPGDGADGVGAGRRGAGGRRVRGRARAPAAAAAWMRWVTIRRAGERARRRAHTASRCSAGGGGDDAGQLQPAQDRDQVGQCREPAGGRPGQQVPGHARLRPQRECPAAPAVRAHRDDGRAGASGRRGCGVAPRRQAAARVAHDQGRREPRPAMPTAVSSIVRSIPPPARLPRTSATPPRESATLEQPQVALDRAVEGEGAGPRPEVVALGWGIQHPGERGGQARRIADSAPAGPSGRPRGSPAGRAGSRC